MDVIAAGAPLLQVPPQLAGIWGTCSLGPSQTGVCGGAGQGWRTACLRGQVPRVAATRSTQAQTPVDHDPTLLNITRALGDPGLRRDDVRFDRDDFRFDRDDVRFDRDDFRFDRDDGASF